jgi:hypothetical protein
MSACVRAAAHFSVKRGVACSKVDSYRIPFFKSRFVPHHNLPSNGGSPGLRYLTVLNDRQGVLIACLFACGWTCVFAFRGYVAGFTIVEFDIEKQVETMTEALTKVRTQRNVDETEWRNMLEMYCWANVRA